jgi:hypothetical protein
MVFVWLRCHPTVTATTITTQVVLSHSHSFRSILAAATTATTTTTVANRSTQRGEVTDKATWKRIRETVRLSNEFYTVMNCQDTHTRVNQSEFIKPM